MNDSDSRGFGRQLSVLMIPLYDEKWASSRYRLYNYVPEFERLGIRCRVTAPPKRDLSSRLFYLAKILILAGRLDIVFIQKKIFKKPFLFLLKKRNPSIVFDMDDAMFARPTSVPVEAFDENRIRDSLNYQLGACTCVVVGNRFLKQYAVSCNPDVRIVPTPVAAAEIRNRDKGQPNAVTVGWIGNRENLVYLRDLETVFRKVSQVCGKELFFKVICDEPLVLKDVRIKNVPWSLKREIDDLSEVDIGIMPLRDDDWSKGKCAFKILQFMSLGIPVVASAVGMNKEVVQAGVNGFLANTDEEWIRCISQLVQEDALRADLGRLCKKTIAAKYSYATTTPLLADILRHCAARSRPFETNT
jgi:glycosyltransferase involved in cell wall biosynthesis